MSADVGAVVPAAGQGARFGGRVSKPLAALRGRPLIAHALDALERTPSIGWIVLVARPEDRPAMARMTKAARWRKLSAIVPGGATRAESVTRGIDALPAAARWVLVHDGARPCLTSELAESVIKAAKPHGAAASGRPAWLTVKAVDEDLSVRLTLDRDGLWFVQTPQVFCRDWVTEALGLASRTATNGKTGGRVMTPAQFTDDAALLEWAGFPVRMVPGDPWNIKVTTQEDVILAEAILQAQARRTPAAKAAGPRRVRTKTSR